MSNRRIASNTPFMGKVLNRLPLVLKSEMFLIFSLVSFGFALTIISLTLEVHITPSTNFGESVEGVVPLWYWLGIAIIIAAISYMLTRLEVKKFRILFLVSCVMMIFSMRSVLAIISPLPPVADTWDGVLKTLTLQKWGILSPEGLRLFSGGYVRGWPTSFILAYLITYAVPLYTFYKWAPIAIFILDLVVVYFLFKELANEKVGMVSAFLFTLLNTNGFFPLHYSAQTLGALFFLIAMYTIVKAYKTRKRKHLAIAFLAIFAVVLTHHMSTFFIGLSIVGAYVSEYFLKIQQRLQEKNGRFSFKVNVDTFIRFSLSLSVLTFALWYFYGFIMYGIDANWMLTEIMRLLTTHQPIYKTGYYGRYLLLSPVSQISFFVFPGFVLGTAAATLFGRMFRRESLDGYLWLTMGWAGMLGLAFIVGNLLYGNYIEPLRAQEIITIALYPASALFLLEILESKAKYKKILFTLVVIAVAFFSIMSIYRGAQSLIYFEPPWWMIYFTSP